MKFAKKLLILISIFLVVKLFFMTRPHNVIWDESVYLAMGKFLYSSGQMGLWEIVRPIGLPLILGFIWKTGLPYIFFSELFVILISALFISLVYLIGAKIFDKNTALMAALLTAITPVFFLYSSYLLTDIVSTFFVLLAFYFYIKKKIVLCGIFSAVGFLFRFPLGLFLLVVLLALIADYFLKKDSLKASIKKISFYIASFFITVLPYLIFNYMIYHKETSRWWHAAFRPFILGAWAQFNPAEAIAIKTIWDSLYNIFYYPVVLFVSNIFLILSIFGIIIFFKKRLYKQCQFNIVFVALAVFLLYFSYISNKQLRFSLTFLPYICLFSAYALTNIINNFKKHFHKIIAHTIIIVVIALIINFDLSYYLWRPKTEPSIVTEYYKYFLDKDINGPILTTDPVPAAYVDAQFIPIYFSIELANRDYPLYKDKIFAAIYSPDHFYCGEEDAACKDEVNKLTSDIKEENELVFSTTYTNKNYYIYTN